MSININEISPKLVLVNPASEIEGNELIPITSLPAYDTTKSLTGNKPTFVRRVHARLFVAKVQSSQYIPDFENMTLNYEGGNKREAETMDTLSQDSLNEAFIISDEISKWFGAAKRGLHVKVPHAGTAASIEVSMSEHADLDDTYFDIEVGNNNATPKGLDI